MVPETAQIMCSLTMPFVICTLLCQAPNGSAANKQWSLCVFDDVIEHTGSVSIKLGLINLKEKKQTKILSCH